MAVERSERLMDKLVNADSSRQRSLAKFAPCRAFHRDRNCEDSSFERLAWIVAGEGIVTQELEHIGHYVHCWAIHAANIQADGRAKVNLGRAHDVAENTKAKLVQLCLCFSANNCVRSTIPDHGRIRLTCSRILDSNPAIRV